MSDLNVGQTEAAEGFFKFLFSEEKELIISGPGGVGKTHLMSNMIDNILPTYFQTCKLMGVEPEYENVQMCATTNKAADVLHVATKRPTQTIHSYLNLKVQDNFKTGESKLSKTHNWTVHEKTILFIDECSMIDRNLLRYIDDGLHKSKIIYVGDHCQLAPVREPISPIYNRNLPFFELTEPMRTKNFDLMALQAQLRKTVETGEFQPIKIIPGVIDHLNSDAMQLTLLKEFSQQTHDSRILAYTNLRVMQYNDYIRQIRNLGQEYTIGELLINNNALRMKSEMLSIEEGLTIIRQSDQIQDIMIEPNVFLKVRDSTIETDAGEIFNDVLIPVDREHFAELIKYYSKAKNWERYFFLKNTFPDFRQRDAATVHKSQGSTYENVFIDLTNISTCHKPNEVARMLYVAFTRPRSRVYLFGELAPKYGGLSF